MEKEKKKHRTGSNKALIVMLLLILAVLIALAVYLSTKRENNDTLHSMQTENTGYTIEGTETEPEFAETISENAETEQLTGYRIDTPAGALYYPEEWEDSLIVEEKTDGETYIAEFFCTLNDRKVCIFRVLMGDEDTGYLLGSIHELPICIDVAEIENQKKFSDEELTQVTEMQNRVNDILDQIYHLDGFVKSVK